MYDGSEIPEKTTLNLSTHDYETFKEEWAKLETETSEHNDTLHILKNKLYNSSLSPELIDILEDIINILEKKKR